MNTRRFVGGVPVLERHSFSREDERALDALERKQVGEAMVTPKPSPAAPVPAPRMGPSKPPFSFTSAPPKPAPAEPPKKVRKTRTPKVAAVAQEPKPTPTAAPAIAKPDACAALGRTFVLPPAAPSLDVAIASALREADEITDTADLRAFLIRQMKLAADGKVSPNTAHQVCLFAEKIMQATQLELEAEKVLNLCRRDTLRTVDLLGTP